MNFDFLKQEQDLAALFNYCKEAESFARSNPDISITAARKAMEFVTKLLYGTQIRPDISGLTLFDMLTDYDFVTYINSKEVIDAIHLIRKKGNLAVHEGNLTEANALEVLERLHFVAGEVCIKLKLIESYPAFDWDFKADEPQNEAMETREVDEALIHRLSDWIKNQLRPAEFAETGRTIINVHVNPAKESKESAEQKRQQGTDVGANAKTAFHYLAKYISSSLPEVTVLMQNVSLKLVLVKNNKETVFVVKTGCTILGTKDYTGEWNVLPGVDYVLYAPDVVAGTPIHEQFRIFTRAEFYAFWEELGLLRYKVSTAMRKKVGGAEKISAEEFADTLTVQSFTNSRKKHPMVLSGLEKQPKFDIREIESRL